MADLLIFSNSQQDLELYGRCRDGLLASNAFDSDSNVRNLFSHPTLIFYLDSIPAGNTPQERVDAFLRSVGVRIFTGVPVLALVFEVLAERLPQDDQQRNGFVTLAQLVRGKVQPVIQPTQPGQPAQPVQPAPGVGGETPVQALFRSLLLMDFRAQAGLAQRIAERESTVAFLVYGDPELGSTAGQDLLIRRLLITWEKAWGKRDGPRLIRVDLSQPGLLPVPRTLWDLVSKPLGLTPGTDPDRIVEEFKKAWSTQDFVFIFQRTEYMVRTNPTLLGQWLGDFWRRLVTALRGAFPVTNQYAVCLLVDTAGDVVNAPDVQFAQDPAANFNAELPFSLPRLDRLSEETLREWIDNQLYIQSALPPGTRVDAHKLWSDSYNGTPLEVCKRICDYCGINWEGEMLTWLTV